MPLRYIVATDIYRLGIGVPGNVISKVCLCCHPLQSIHIRGKRIPGHRPDTTPQPGIIYVVSYFKAVTTVPPPLLQLKPGILVTPILRMA